MTEIPDDIMKAAADALLAGGYSVRIGSDGHKAIARAILSERQRAWLPIATAPKDDRFLAVVDGEVRVVSYGKTSHVPIEGFCLADQGPEDFDLCRPTAWQLLPPSPKPAAVSEGGGQ